VSPELRLIAAPGETYAALVRTHGALPALAALRRPLLVCLVIGVSVAISATGHITPRLVLSTTMTWSYVVVLQLAIALPLVVPRAPRRVGGARALDLFFAGHAPWSLFALAVAGLMPAPLGGPSRGIVVGAGALALALTARIVVAFFREVLDMSQRDAWRMTAVHQGITWTVLVAVNWLHSAFTPRLIELWRR
jgi:hypothetical protein